MAYTGKTSAKILLPTTTITTAGAGTTTNAINFNTDVISLDMMAVFDYGSGGTSAQFWVQTSIDGTNWHDIANFAFATADLVKEAACTSTLAHTHRTATDGTLADNTVINGFIGNQLRVKYTTVGIYAGSTTIKIMAVPKCVTVR